MRFTIILMIVMIINCDAIRGVNVGRYMRNLNRAINNLCNKEAYIITKNTEIYNCFMVNNTFYKCNHLENFTDYQKVRLACLNKNQTDFGSGILITFVIWIMLGVWFSQTK